jgi:hypothetical protein
MKYTNILNYVTQDIRGAPIFQNSRSHLKALGDVLRYK